MGRREKIDFLTSKGSWLSWLLKAGLRSQLSPLHTSLASQREILLSVALTGISNRAVMQNAGGQLNLNWDILKLKGHSSSEIQI